MGAPHFGQRMATSSAGDCSETLVARDSKSELFEAGGSGREAACSASGSSRYFAR